MRTIAVIPARLDSHRLPRKVLAEVGGRPLLWHAWNRARQAARIERVVVLTDSEEVRAAVQQWGGEALMTNAECGSGTHRIASALEQFDAELIINVQADEPLVEPTLLDELAKTLQESDVDVITPVYQIRKADELKNPHLVKVVRTADGRAMYFSRSSIPHVRDVPECEWLDHHVFWGHVGIYGYRRRVLEAYDRMPDSACESAERLEQLRLLEAGFSIYTVETTYHGINVDTPEDLAKLRKHLEASISIDGGDAQPRGVILFNRGTKCLVRMLVCVHSLRKWWNGPVTAFLEGKHPAAFERMLRDMNVQVVYSSNSEAGAFIRKVEVCCETPYGRTLWLDSDTIVCGPINAIFDALDEHEVVIPHFADWWSNGRMLRKRIERYRGKCPDEWIDEALQQHPAINVGVFAFRQETTLLEPWLELSRKGDHRQVFLPEEIAFQILYPKHDVGIIDQKYGVSVKHDPGTEDIRIIHYHGQKHVHDFPLCDAWKRTFDELRAAHPSQFDQLFYLADRRLKRYIGISTDVTIVTACDPQYVEKLRVTFPNWVRFKRVDWYPMIVFIHGMETTDSRLDFLRLPNVRLIAWDIDADNQRERMLNAFVAGTAQHVETKWWFKLDADAFATNQSPLVTEEMKQYVIYGHRWGRSRADHIQQLDQWAASHRRLDTLPMFDTACVKGDKFLHPRTQSFAQLHSSRFTRYCHKLARGRMPVPSHDTYMFYVADRLGHAVGRANFKKHHGVDHCSSLRRLRDRVSTEPNVDVTDVAQGTIDALAKRSLDALPARTVIAAAERSWQDRPNEGSPQSYPKHARALLRLLDEQLDDIRCGAEVGVQQGDTSSCLLESLSQLRLYMVDAWSTYAPDSTYYQSGDSSARLTAVQQHEHRSEAMARTEFAAERRVVLHMDSCQATGSILDGELDFVFLDADHTYDALSSDIDRWWQKLRRGGILCGKDYGHPRDRRGVWGVSQAVDELVDRLGLSLELGAHTLWWIEKPAAANEPTA